MNILTVMAKQLTYPIYFDNSYDNLQNAVKYSGLKRGKAAVISDFNVAEIYLSEVVDLLKEVFSEVYSITFPAGEKSKNLDIHSVVVALGGGVTGDMAGFAASTFMRGVPFVQLPTSLLSQVDSSVGGKVGVDFMGNKNYIGAFYQPRFVYINSKALDTLPTEQFSSGMGEVIKHGLIKDESYYKFIIDKSGQILEKDSDTLEKLIEGSCRIKAGVVELDEREDSLRKILNFGHTFGHAIESLSSFTELHGHCVAHGMRGALYLSYALGGITRKELEKFDSLLRNFGIPRLNGKYSADEIYSQMLIDKKRQDNTLNLILLNEIGNAYVENNAPKEHVIDSIEYILKGALE